MSTVIISDVKRLTDSDVDVLIEQCIKLARKKPPEFFNLKKMKKVWGWCNWTDIEIDPRYNLLATAIHECIHYLYPEWSETQVLYTESRIMNQAKMVDLMRFLKYLSLKLYKNESINENMKNRKEKKSKQFKIKKL